MKCLNSSPRAEASSASALAPPTKSTVRDTNRVLFVGERRSARARRMNVRWEDGRLAAKQLFDAFAACGFRGAHAFCNAFERGSIRRIRCHNGPVIAMGRKAQVRLDKAGIHYVPMIHPAARGAIRLKARYAAHVARVLAEAGAT